jgi:LacI family transcriptional regulator, gluconate utilization system Gnt-I transcriptional repressor
MSSNGALKKPQRAVRMEDVAKRAGVSLMTVSRALRFPETVAESTRARIEAASAELSYVGSAIAGQLATGRTRLVAVVLPDLRNPAFALAMQGLSDALGEQFELIVSSAHGAPEGEERVIRALLGYRPAALVIHGNRHNPETRELLKRASIPVVEIGSLVGRPVNLSVGYSNRSAGKAATEHLLARGYRRLGFVSQSKQRNSRAEERWQGFREALKGAGIEARPELELETELGYARGAKALQELMRQDRHLDAVFFTSDGWALGALFHCQRKGIAVPGQIALMGFDDQELASLTVPALTTIHVPRYEMGWEAGKLLHAQLTGASLPRKRLDLGFELIQRETT